MKDFLSQLPALENGWTMSSGEILMPLNLNEVWTAFFADDAKYAMAANM